MTAIDPDFRLIECFLYQPETGYRYLDAHLYRLQQSAKTFNFHYPDTIQEEINQHANQYTMPGKHYKVRLELNKKGGLTLEFNEIDQLHQKAVKIKLYLDQRIDQRNLLYQHKTTNSPIRDFYNNVYRQQSESGNYFDIILANQSGYICEGTRSNIFIKYNNHWLTPKIECGLLPGVMRALVLKNQPTIKTANITIKQLEQAEEIFITNSVRGKMQAIL